MSFALADIGEDLRSAVAGFAPGATVRRVYVFRDDFNDVTGLDIAIVMPRSQEPVMMARKKDAKRSSFDIVFRKALTANPSDTAAVTAEVDGLLETVEAVADGINGLEMGTGKWTGEVNQELLFDHELLNTGNQFKSNLNVQYMHAVEART